MPVRWNIDHSQRLVEAVAEGPSEPGELMKLLDAIEAEHAIAYRKLFDGSRVVARLDGRAMGPLAARISAYGKAGAGPLAIVVPTSGPADGIARLFVLLGDAEGRARVFRSTAEAREWLNTMANLHHDPDKA